MQGPQLTDASGRASLVTIASEAGASSVTRYLPQVLLATLVVAVGPIVAVSALSAAGLVSSYLLTGGLAVALSAGASWAGATWWKRRAASRDLLFCDLMIWGWMRRWHAERRLSDARSLLGRGSEPGLASDVRRERQLDLFESLAHALEARDSYTHGHTRRVTRYAALIARRMHLPRDEIARVSAGAAVHDVGKINVPRGVLNKPGRLTDGEFAIVALHPEHGARMVELVGDTEIAAMVRHHHERLDGTGYPGGLAGDEIPLGARIIAVADTFDAITSSRAYRGAKSHRQAMEILRREAGTQLDPTAVRAFCDHYSGRRGLAWWVLLTTAPQRLLTWLATELSSAGLGAAAPWVSALAVTVPLGGSLLAAPLLSTHHGARSATISAARATFIPLTAYPPAISPLAGNGTGAAGTSHTPSGHTGRPVSSVGPALGPGGGSGTPSSPTAGSSAPTAPGQGSIGTGAPGTAPTAAGAGPGGAGATAGGGGTGGGTASSGTPPGSTTPGGTTSGATTPGSTTGGGGGVLPGVSGGSGGGGGVTVGGGSVPLPSVSAGPVTVTPPAVAVAPPTVTVAPGPVLPTVKVTLPKVTVKLPGLHLGP